MQDVQAIIGWHPGGCQITRAELWGNLDISLQQIKNGQTLSMEEVIRQSENWLS